MKNLLKLIFVFASIVSFIASVILIFTYIEDLTRIACKIKNQIKIKYISKRGTNIEAE